MTGAIAIAAQSALRSGAGLISVAAPDRCIDLIASYHPCYMTIPLPDLQSGHFLAERSQNSKPSPTDSTPSRWGQVWAKALMLPNSSQVFIETNRNRWWSTPTG